MPDNTHIRSDLGWKPTYDKFPTKEAAIKDAARRRKHAPSRTRFQIKHYGGEKHVNTGLPYRDKEYWTVEYKEAD